MLTNEEKERIRGEEIFRQTIRLELERKKNPKSVGGKIWAFLNTSFGLWVLSTIAVGFITWSYTTWEQRRIKEQSRSEIIRKLDAEIASRIQFFQYRLDTALAIDEYARAIRILSSKPVEGERHPEVVFPEFENRSLRSLLYEIVQLVPKDEKAEINNSLVAIQNLPHLDFAKKPEEGWEDPLPPEYQAERENMKRVIQEKVKLKRWGTTE